jgi:hypothetical protein
MRCLFPEAVASGYALTSLSGLYYISAHETD